MPVEADIYYHLFEGAGEGQRPPVVLIHGAGGSHLSWPSEVRRLPGYRVYAPDLPGHGKSGGRGMQSIPAYTQSVLDWLSNCGLHSAVFVGHSMGSAIALSLALDHPEQVLGLGLVGAGARLRVQSELFDLTCNATTFQGAIDMILRLTFSPQTSPQLIALVGRRMTETRPSVLHGDFLACSSFDEMERICQIRQPTLVMCGNDDRMTPPRYAQFLATNIPGANLEAIPDAGHMVMLEQPRAVAAALGKFLAGIQY
jgi:pimeloyl-ACP methyl ester carboxylesterase